MGFFEMIWAAFAAWFGWYVMPVLTVIFFILALFLISSLFTAIDDKIKSFRRNEKERE